MMELGALERAIVHLVGREEAGAREEVAVAAAAAVTAVVVAVEAVEAAQTDGKHN
jgi:hypothetical protein